MQLLTLLWIWGPDSGISHVLCSRSPFMPTDWNGDHSGHPCILQTLSHHSHPLLFLCWPTKIGPVPPFPLLSSHVGPYSSLSQGPCFASQPVAKVPLPNLDSESCSSRLRSLSPPAACYSCAYPWLVWLDLLLLTAQAELENYLPYSPVTLGLIESFGFGFLSLCIRTVSPSSDTWASENPAPASGVTLIKLQFLYPSFIKYKIGK